ncbi:glycosyl hydrolase family 3 N terminal domain-containing protein [Aspergillus californicus]
MEDFGPGMSLPVATRVQDLLGRMTLEEKAGLLFHNTLVMGQNGYIAPAIPEMSLEGTETAIKGKLLNHFNLLGSIGDARTTALWHNRIQCLALETRLGIPITLSSDPRHHFTENVGTGFEAGELSQWPETLGLAALRSPATVEHFADIVRREYLAIGLRLALHPQVDLATEPRWARISGGFGEDADLSSSLVTAYIRGLQTETLGPCSVSAMTKHFPGSGPQKDGEDPHFSYGREQIYPGNQWDYHLKPFQAAIAAKTAQMMPYYGMPVGTEYEAVGFAFNRAIISGLLREKLGFDGIICSDWGLVTDGVIMGQEMPARAWGVEHLSELERIQRLLEAGCDQLGGESRPELVVQLVQTGRISESRVDTSVRRLLTEKFVLGLFDEQRFVDVDLAPQIVGSPELYDAGQDAQRRAYTLLKNKEEILPLSSQAEGGGCRKVYLEGIELYLARSRGFTVVASPEEADLAILRWKAPYEPRPGGFEAMFHAGALDFSPAEQARQASIFRAVPLSIVDLYMDRPAVIPNTVESATAVLVNFGSSADALMDVIFGVAQPEGKLPFDLPSSMEAVQQSRPDVPYDTHQPLFRFEDGLTYRGE